MPKGDRDILKADPEDGITPISNLLLAALAMAHLSGEEKGAVIYIWRLTYGWEAGEGRRHTHDEIPLHKFAAALNTHPQYVARILNRLVRKRVILRTDLGKGKGYLYTTNTRVNEWDNGCLNGLELSRLISEGLYNRYKVPSTKKITPSDTKLASSKEKEIKDEINKKKQSSSLSSYKSDESKPIDTEITLDGDKIMSAQELWSATLVRLSEHLTPSNYASWFENTEGVGFENNTFYIGAANILVPEVMQRRFKVLVEKTVEEITGKHLRLRAVYLGEMKNAE